MAQEGEPDIENKMQPPEEATEGKVERIATTSSENQVYSIHSKTKKRLLCCLAASAGFLSPFTANIYFPALNNIQKVKSNVTHVSFRSLSPPNNIL